MALIRLKLLRWTLFTALLLSITSFHATLGFGQATNAGTIIGVVEDQSGAIVPGATITLIETATNASRTTVTNKTGQYVFTSVPPASYTITRDQSRIRAGQDR